ncbi:NAD(P)-binding protein [Luedemannella flava]
MRATSQDPGNDVDAIVVGGGHNGLVAAAFLARAGLKPLVLEARPDTGGAARTDTPWGPEFKMTSLSYVMSLMPPTIVDQLRLREHGYRVIPMGPTFVPYEDKRSLLLTEDPARDYDQIAAFSRHDADAMIRYTPGWAASARSSRRC